MKDHTELWDDNSRSHRDIDAKFDITEKGAKGTLNFPCGFQLTVWLEKHKDGKESYSYHCQRPDGTFVFRYDDAPHYPDLPTFPDHKHIGDKVIAANRPTPQEVFREIYNLIDNE